MKRRWLPYAGFIMLAEGVGALAAWLTRDGMELYRAVLNKPPLSPPGIVFPIVWAILYLLMGYAAYRVQISGKDPVYIRRSMIFYGLQLFLNFLWPIVFFGLEWQLVAFFLLLALWALIYITMRLFSAIDEPAGDLLIPYILWVTFAAYLNLGVYLLN